MITYVDDEVKSDISNDETDEQFVDSYLENLSGVKQQLAEKIKELKKGEETKQEEAIMEGYTKIF